MILLGSAVPNAAIVLRSPAHADPLHPCEIGCTRAKSALDRGKKFTSKIQKLALIVLAWAPAGTAISTTLTDPPELVAASP
jgi:hypothetical protein